MTYVLDSSAILRFLDNEPGALDVERLLKTAVTGSTTLLMSAANWAEVLYVVLKYRGPVVMQNIEDRLQSLPIQVISVDSQNGRMAAEFRHKHQIAFADSFAGSLAQYNKAVLVTADQDFRSTRSTIKVQFLPAKAKPAAP